MIGKIPPQIKVEPWINLSATKPKAPYNAQQTQKIPGGGQRSYFCHPLWLSWQQIHVAFILLSLSFWVKGMCSSWHH